METNKKLNKEVYEAPVMEMVEIQVEQGFQMSGQPSQSLTYDPLKEKIF